MGDLTMPTKIEEVPQELEFEELSIRGDDEHEAEAISETLETRTNNLSASPELKDEDNPSLEPYWSWRDFNRIAIDSGYNEGGTQQENEEPIADDLWNYINRETSKANVDLLI